LPGCETLEVKIRASDFKLQNTSLENQVSAQLHSTTIRLSLPPWFPHHFSTTTRRTSRAKMKPTNAPTVSTERNSHNE